MKVIRVTKPPDISHRSQQNPGNNLIIRIDRCVQIFNFYFHLNKFFIWIPKGYSKECAYAKLDTGEQYDPVMPSVLIIWIRGSP